MALSSPNGKTMQEVNFISAKIVCPECIANGQWKESLIGRECEVCGENRTVTFGHRDFHETEVDYHEVCENPIVDCVQWLLYGFSLDYDTYCYAHNGKCNLYLDLINKLN
jgi:hypothetical protein